MWVLFQEVQEPLLNHCFLSWGLGHRVQSWKRPASPDLKRVEAEYGTNMDRLLERKDNCFQSAATFESCRKDDSPIPARTSLLVLAEDTLINQSPCVSIPQINNPIRKRKPAPLEPIQPKQVPRVLRQFFYALVLRGG